MLQNTDKRRSIPVDRRTVDVVMLNGNSIQFNVEVSNYSNMWQTQVQCSCHIEVITAFTVGHMSYCTCS